MEFREGFADGDGARGEVGGHAGGGVFGGVGACSGIILYLVVDEMAESLHSCFVACGPEVADPVSGLVGVKLFGFWHGGDIVGGILHVYGLYVLGWRWNGVEK